MVSLPICADCIVSPQHYPHEACSLILTDLQSSYTGVELNGNNLQYFPLRTLPAIRSFIKDSNANDDSSGLGSGSEETEEFEKLEKDKKGKGKRRSAGSDNSSGKKIKGGLQDSTDSGSFQWATAPIFKPGFDFLHVMEQCESLDYDERFGYAYAVCSQHLIE